MSDPNNYKGIGLSRDSGVLLTMQSDWLSNIWMAPDGDSNRVKQITTGKYDGKAGGAWARGGKIVYGTRDWVRLRWTPDGKVLTYAGQSPIIPYHIVVSF